jgi:hypothetical protein
MRHMNCSPISFHLSKIFLEYNRKVLIGHHLLARDFGSCGITLFNVSVITIGTVLLLRDIGPLMILMTVNVYYFIFSQRSRRSIF